MQFDFHVRLDHSGSSWKKEEGLEELFLILFRAQKEHFPVEKKRI